eukprot:445550_1
MFSVISPFVTFSILASMVNFQILLPIQPTINMDQSHQYQCIYPIKSHTNLLNDQPLLSSVYMVCNIWFNGTLICGKRCSTKHNLIKHLKALHTNHRIIDLSQSVKAHEDIYIYNHTASYAFYIITPLRISPRKNKKRPRFTNTNIISPIDNGIVNVIKHNSYHNKHNSVPITQPPKKKIKMDPDAMNTNINASSVPTALPIYSTGDNFVNHSNKRKKKKKQKKKSKKKTKKRQSVQQQGDFVGLLLEAA